MKKEDFPAFDNTETIDLEKLGLDHLSQTGSFVVSAIEQTSFGKLLYGIPTPIVLLNMPEPNIYMVNGSAARFVGFSSQASGRSIYDYLKDDEVRRVQRAVTRLYSTRKHQVTEAWVGSPDRSIWARMHFQSLRLAGKKYALLVLEDLTHEKQELSIKAEALQRQNMLLRQEVNHRRLAEEELKKKKQALERTLWDTIGALSKITEMRDPYTAGHMQRVTQLARAIADKMGLHDSRKAIVAVAANVHDIGKARVPNDLLTKPGILDEHEAGILQRHPEDGYKILTGLQLPRGVAESVLQHHERIDGSGYPSHLKGDEILLEARIIAVADVVEAMSSHRPHRPAFGLKDALKEVSKYRGIQYDPNAVDACYAVLQNGFRFTTAPFKPRT